MAAAVSAADEQAFFIRICVLQSGSMSRQGNMPETV